MPRLDHINIHVGDGPRMVAFFEQVLGAREGVRPPFGNRGHWIYVDGVPAIHLDAVERRGDFPQGMVNHVAFGVYDFEETKARIEATGYSYKLTGIPDSDIGQFFVNGPEGLLLEIQFRREASTGPA
jgi:catechol 2,3-dioxygenase-like lactoylglutathione lyase family enzyme